MTQEPMMFSSIAPAPLFSGRHHASRDPDTYAFRYLDSSSSPYSSTLPYLNTRPAPPKRHSSQHPSSLSPHRQHTRSSSLQYQSYHRSRTTPPSPNLSKPGSPNLSKPLPPPPPQEPRTEQSKDSHPTTDSVLAMMLDAIPQPPPEKTGGQTAVAVPHPGRPASSRSPPRNPFANKPSTHKRKGSATGKLQKPIPSTIIEVPTPIQSTVLETPIILPASISPPPPISPSSLPTFNITCSQRHKRRFYTYTPANLSSHPIYTMQQESDHVFQVRRNASTVAEIKTGLTGHHAKITFPESFDLRTDVERRGHAHGHGYHYPVELTALGQTCDWKIEEGGRFVLRDGCMGTVVARADAGEGGGMEVLIEGSETALDEVMASAMAVVEIHREDKEDGLARSVVDMVGRVI